MKKILIILILLSSLIQTVFAQEAKKVKNEPFKFSQAKLNIDNQKLLKSEVYKKFLAAAFDEDDKKNDKSKKNLGSSYYEIFNSLSIPKEKIIDINIEVELLSLTPEGINWKFIINTNSTLDPKANVDTIAKLVSPSTLTLVKSKTLTIYEFISETKAKYSFGYNAKKTSICVANNSQIVENHFQAAKKSTPKPANSIGLSVHKNDQLKSLLVPLSKSGMPPFNNPMVSGILMSVDKIDFKVNEGEGLILNLSIDFSDASMATLSKQMIVGGIASAKMRLGEHKLSLLENFKVEVVKNQIQIKTVFTLKDINTIQELEKAGKK